MMGLLLLRLVLFFFAYLFIYLFVLLRFLGALSRGHARLAPSFVLRLAPSS
jgi:hypothetical protein